MNRLLLKVCFDGYSTSSVMFINLFSVKPDLHLFGVFCWVSTPGCRKPRLAKRDMGVGLIWTNTLILFGNLTKTNKFGVLGYF